MRLSFEEIQSEIKRVFMKYGLSEEKADTCARIHTESTYDGIYSHGTNRVARFVDYIQKGWVDVNADPTIEKDCGAIKVINGNNGTWYLKCIIWSKSGNGDGRQIRNWYGRSEEYNTLDAWRHIWSLCCQKRLCRYYVDQYRSMYATLGSKRVPSWK